MVFFGTFLRRSGRLTPEAHQFITFLVFNFCLPVLIFTGIAREDFRSLLEPAVLASTLSVTFISAGLAWLFARGLAASLRGPFIAAVFMGNVTYIGFPLASNAFGDSGLTYAGIVNAFTMPVFMVLAVILLTAGRANRGSLLRQLRLAIVNPVVLAALGGVVGSLVVHETAWGVRAMSSRSASECLRLAGAILKPIGAMGLPLALIAVGASLRFDAVRGRIGLMSACAAGRLIVTPLLTFLVCRLFFPAAPAAASGTAVLLMGCPMSVALYVIAKQQDAEPEFLAGVLVLTTVGSCVALPLWLAIVL